MNTALLVALCAAATLPVVSAGFWLEDIASGKTSGSASGIVNFTRLSFLQDDKSRGSGLLEMKGNFSVYTCEIGLSGADCSEMFPGMLTDCFAAGNDIPLVTGQKDENDNEIPLMTTGITAVGAVCGCYARYGAHHPKTVSDNPFCVTAECMSHADACTQWNGATYLMLIAMYVEFFATLFFVLFGIYLLVGLLRKKESLKNATGSTLICLIAAGFFQSLWVVSYPQQIQSGSFVYFNAAALSVGLCFTAVFACFGMMNLSLMWLEVARASKTMKKSGVNLSKKPLFIVIAVSILFFIIMTLFWTILRIYTLGGLAAIVFMLSIGASYLIGARELDQVMSSTNKGGKKSPRLLKIIATARIMFRWIIAFVLFDVIYALTSNIKTLQTTAITYIHIVAIAGILLSNITIFAYVMDYIRDATLVKRGFKRRADSKMGTTVGGTTSTTTSEN